MKILVIGINVRHIACSAARAGHQVYAIDCYCDLDLARCASETALLPREKAEEYIPNYLERFCPDAVVFGPGLEEASAKGFRVLNNPPEKTSQVADKLWLAGWLEENGFPCIPTLSSSDEAVFPAVVKPRKGAGGVGCRIVRKQEELQMQEGLIIQELIAGRPASVSVISTGREARALAVNEQLIGEAWAGAEGFRYCGNITPLEPPHCGMAGMAEEIIAGLGLVGSNGVDFLLTEKGPVAVEVNPRFQGSLDTVEHHTGLNVFQAHLEAFEGRLPPRCAAALPLHEVAGRAIIYAHRDLQIKEDLSGIWTTDVPQPGSRIKKADPIMSVQAMARSRDDVLALLKERVSGLYRSLDAKL